MRNPVRSFDFVEKLEWFLVSAVVMILVIRTQLWLTNYPQLGGSGLHIAHLLYGGIFMAIAIWVSLIYLNRRGRAVTAILGGIGFGFFIDELGKFITEDNDYFFKPAAGPDCSAIKGCPSGLRGTRADNPDERSPLLRTRRDRRRDRVGGSFRSLTRSSPLSSASGSTCCSMRL